MSSRHLDLLFAFLLSATITLIVAVFPGWEWPLRVLLGLSVMLLVPGYVMTVALFPKRNDLDVSGRLVLSLGLSVVVMILLGLLLNFTPWGVRPLPIGLAVCAWVLAMGALAVYRRSRLAPADWFYPAPRTTLLPLLVFAATLFMGVLLVQVLRPPERFTEFYLLGPGGRMEGYPNRLAPGQPFSVTVGVRNREAGPQTYRVQLPSGLNPLTTRLLQPGQSWEQPVQVRAPAGQGRTRLVFQLFRQGDSQPYREVYLWVELGGTP